MLKFNFCLETVNLDDKIWHLLVADIELDKANAMKQQLLHNEIMPPIIEKQKFLEANKRSVYQLLDLIKKTPLVTVKNPTLTCSQKSSPLSIWKIWNF